MKKLLAALFLAVPIFAASFRVDGVDAGPWKHVFAAVNIVEGKSSAEIVVTGPKADLGSLNPDGFLIVVGADAPKTIAARHIVDVHDPSMQIIWAAQAQVPVITLPAGFQVFATERWSGAPVLAGKRTEKGAVLWVATDPGPEGMERYPYLLHAMADLGLKPSAGTDSLWAFFDSSYRIRADLDYLARRWRAGGIGVLHAAAWHNMEPDSVQDDFLTRLIAACHRNGIAVYAWLELPHVSEKFWMEHPEWREKTAAGQDAQLDWRKLMNLQNPDCRKAVTEKIATLLQRFDWDGVNMAELYFESLEGAANPARFTPMNADVRAEFKEINGFDPALLFDSSSPYAHDTVALKKFLDFRAVLAARMQSDWLHEMQAARKAKPYLDVVLTHIDDRFDPEIRNELGADVARALPLMKANRSTLLVEDPANLWDLGPERYSKLGAKYKALTSEPVSIDINVVERYQDVYPTKKQTGVELFELLHEAAESFSHVAVYFENSIEKPDLKLIAAAATPAVVSGDSGGIKVQANDTTRISATGLVSVDGQPWALRNASYVLVPAGAHTVRASQLEAPVHIGDFNARIRSVATGKTSVAVSYSSATRAIARETDAASIDIDGAPYWTAANHGSSEAILLPAGEHIAVFRH